MGAVFSRCKQYRYRLDRDLLIGDDEILFVMLNPSTADAEKSDPTVTRCLNFAKRWGFRHVKVGNLFALRSTDPTALYRTRDPVGPENDYHLRMMSHRADLTVVAWGVRGGYLARDVEVLELLSRPVEHLGLTKRGRPRHPLYLRTDAVRTVMEEV